MSHPRQKIIIATDTDKTIIQGIKGGGGDA